MKKKELENDTQKSRIKVRDLTCPFQNILIEISFKFCQIWNVDFQKDNKNSRLAGSSPRCYLKVSRTRHDSVRRISREKRTRMSLWELTLDGATHYISLGGETGSDLHTALNLIACVNSRTIQVEQLILSVYKGTATAIDIYKFCAVTGLLPKILKLVY